MKIYALTILFFVLSLFSYACGDKSTESVPSSPSIAQTAVEPAAPNIADLVLDLKNNSDFDSIASQGKEIFPSSICGTCHSIDGTNPESTIGPDLTGISSAAGSRIAGLSAEEYIAQSVLDPATYLVDGYDNLMTPGLEEILGDDFEPILAYLFNQK